MQKSSSSSSGTMENMTSSSTSSESKTVTCDISGAVKHEGVYTLKNGARLQELIEAAGGTTSRAQLKAINRAVLLKDQDKIHIPYKGEKVENAATVGAGSQSNATSGESSSSQQENGEKVNLNTASAADLQKLNGIGEKKAEQIIAYREQKGSFKKIEDLMQVSGIGEKTFASLKDQLAV
jgi:competence protein ComEA